MFIFELHFMVRNMKQIFRLVLFLSFAVCRSQNVNVFDGNLCEAVPVASEILQWQYIGLRGDSVSYKSEFANFTKVKNGVLLYKWQEGHDNGQFLVVDFDENFRVVLKTKNLNQEVNFSAEDKKKLKFTCEILEKKSYYQSCRKDHGHANLYILVVRCNNDMKAQYYSPENHPYEIKASDINVYLIQEIFSIMDRNFCKDLKIKKNKKVSKA
ncbi:hypothetical protein SAMN02927916_0520 [Flavobacterium anhuiense]|uniref:Uncharacterized protein n=1 Tax=Flavobacterium anhuiense TaxID=459526 RepID=A0ABY0L7C4_9FLAO|nr:hypothetical protein [Flavobacterium anhuiense]SCX84634.1 hypothetical protein SAMN02927916_0520 [Flavobacterium anhuiense]